MDAVKGGLQNIRNMLPFSDAKEGPLSTLTLSGQRTMTTYAHGLHLAQDAPAEAMEQGLERTRAALEREPVRKVKLSGGIGDPVMKAIPASVNFWPTPWTMPPMASLNLLRISVSRF